VAALNRQAAAEQDAHVAQQEQYREQLAAGGWDVDLWDQLLDRHDGDMEAAYDALGRTGRTGRTAPRAGDMMDSAMEKWAAELRTLGS
jgi:hypothetical protein